ncbi:LacI family DNA-binding transcriptional regulator [Actinospica durhamensis]|uniref:LacI family DNA-binding transcriptional regulator n=1 Tax=Actinospica durhamensis TaxID=1508375 RepID=A0A941IRC9_9ACTN|nr:LacI family DNA-binding transcriptional regulator [Actinospica durhamensis]
MRARRPTIVDVAREAGVSVATVSRLINGDEKVNADYTKRIRAAIDLLGYQPDERARQLRRGRTQTLGATVRSIAEPHPVLRAVDGEARALGLSMIVMSTGDDPEREREAVMAMCRRRVDGILIEPVAESLAYLQPEIDLGLVVVAFDRPAGDVALDTVLSDNRGGIRQAFDHLTALGHRRIAYIGDDERIYTGHERAEAVRGHLRDLGESVDGMVHAGPVHTETVAAALDVLHRLPVPPTALITGNAATTLEAVRCLGTAFGSTTLVGFDDFALVDLLPAAFTVIAQDEARISETILELFRDRLARPTAPVRTVVVPTALIVRGRQEALT